MRARNFMIISLVSVGFMSSICKAQVVIDMPAPAPKATHVKTTNTVNYASSNQEQYSEGDVAIRRYVRSRSGPQYTSGLYDNRRYRYGYGYYSSFFFGFGGGFHHHGHHNNHQGGHGGGHGGDKGGMSGSK